MSNQKNNLRKQQRGITLLEVMLAIVIIAVFVSLLIASRGDIISTVGNANSLRIARMLASQKMEEILLAEVTGEEEAAGGTFEKYPGFTWQQTIQSISLITKQDREDNPDVQEINVQSVTVTVEYENSEGTKVQYSLSTILPYEEETQEGSGDSGG